MSRKEGALSRKDELKCDNEPQWSGSELLQIDIHSKMRTLCATWHLCGSNDWHPASAAVNYAMGHPVVSTYGGVNPHLKVFKLSTLTEGVEASSVGGCQRTAANTVAEARDVERIVGAAVPNVVPNDSPAGETVSAVSAELAKTSGGLSQGPERTSEAEDVPGRPPAVPSHPFTPPSGNTAASHIVSVPSTTVATVAVEGDTTREVDDAPVHTSKTPSSGKACDGCCTVM
jgi:hypothetical protein